MKWLQCFLCVLLVSGASLSAGVIPTDGLTVHLDASALSLNNGDLVSLWNDLSGNGNNATMTGSRLPVYVAPGSADFNGQAYLHFDGIDDRLALPSTVANVNSFRWIIVSRSEPHGLSEYMVGSGDKEIQLRRLATGAFYWRVDQWTATTAGVGGGVHLFELESFNTVTKAIFDGDLLASGTSATSGNPSNLNLGGAPSVANNPFQGDIAEVIVFNRQLTAQEENNVGYYLEQKYGLSTSYVPEPVTVMLLGAGFAWLRKRQ